MADEPADPPTPLSRSRRREAAPPPAGIGTDVPPRDRADLQGSRKCPVAHGAHGPDTAAMIKSKGDDALATLKGSQCFVEGTEVRGHHGTIPIQTMREGDLVLAGNVEAPILQKRDAQAPRSSATAWSTPGHIKSPATSTWLASACESVRRAARTLVLPTAMLAACDVAPPPAAHDVVDVYDARSGTWSGDEAGNIQVGGELLHDGHLFLVTHDGIIDRGPVDAKALADADAAVTEVDVETQPTGASWVLVLADGDTDVRHATLADLELGDHFAFQGRVYETLGATRVEHVRETGEVLGRVVNTYVRTTDGVFDVHIAYPDGQVDTLTGTPNHPFWVPAVQDYVALEDLAVGTVLRTYGGSEATVLGLTWKPGEVEVYDIEVEGLHNFFVRGPGSDGPGVLVHNSTKADDVLYHYTDEAGAKGIAESGVIRADDRGRVFLTSDEVSPGDASDALFMGQGGTKGTHRAEVRLKDDSMLTGEGATQPNELIHQGSVRDPRNAEITVVENDF